MINWFKKFLGVKEEKEPIFGEEEIVGHIGSWLSKEDMEIFQKQYDNYNPLAVDIEICVPPGYYVKRTGEIARRKLLGWKPKNDADQHGEGRPNGK